MRMRFIPTDLSSYSMREKAVRELLTRHCQLLETPESWAKEIFLTEKLCVPAEWIHEAKAVRAHMESDRHLEALYLFKAGHWNRCHKLVIRHLASGECFRLGPVSPGITPNSSNLWAHDESGQKWWSEQDMADLNQITLCKSSLCRRCLVRVRGGGQQQYCYIPICQEYSWYSLIMLSSLFI